jgi:hypothetical protein
MNTASEKFEAINKNLLAGKTVFIATYTKATKITPKTFKSWEASGHKLFKLAGNSLYMARGKKFDCIDYCSIVFNG